MGVTSFLRDGAPVPTQLTEREAGPDLDRAGPGSIVTVEDRFGRLAEYELLGDGEALTPRLRVGPSSPTGFALDGARRGDVVWFPEGDGRPRRFTVRRVKAPPGS